MKRDFIQGECDYDLTMPPEFKGTIGNLIPRITEVIMGVRIYMTYIYRT